MKGVGDLRDPVIAVICMGGAPSRTVGGWSPASVVVRILESIPPSGQDFKSPNSIDRACFWHRSTVGSLCQTSAVMGFRWTNATGFFFLIPLNLPSFTKKNKGGIQRLRKRGVFWGENL